MSFIPTTGCILCNMHILKRRKLFVITCLKTLVLDEDVGLNKPYTVWKTNHGSCITKEAWMFFSISRGSFWEIPRTCGILNPSSKFFFLHKVGFPTSYFYREGFEMFPYLFCNTMTVALVLQLVSHQTPALCPVSTKHSKYVRVSHYL